MTRSEITGIRSLEFSSWIREMLPKSSTGFMVSNQDWVFWNYKTKKLLLAEEKTRGGNLAPWFGNFIRDVMNPALESYCPNHEIKYLGYYLITFEKDYPKNGKIWVWKFGTSSPRLETTESDLIKLLSME